MRRAFHRILVTAATLAASVASAQMHKVAKPEQVVRAVGVYEWTGDFAKPTASRLIPVSVYIEGKFEDAGVYIARPMPFALLTGNVYILQNAGIDKGTLDLAYAKHLQAVESTGDLAYDDGWFGYGSVRPLAAPRRHNPRAQAIQKRPGYRHIVRPQPPAPRNQKQRNHQRRHNFLNVNRPEQTRNTNNTANNHRQHNRFDNFRYKEHSHRRRRRPPHHEAPRQLRLNHHCVEQPKRHQHRQRFRRPRPPHHEASRHLRHDKLRH